MRYVSMIFILFTSSTFAEARVARYEKLVEQLKPLDATDAEDKSKAVEAVSAIEDEAFNFKNKSKHEPKEFSDLVALVAYAAPFMSFPETAGILGEICSESKVLAKAFADGLARVNDVCRQGKLQLQMERAKRPAPPQATDFNYAKCVATQTTKTK